MMERLQKWLRDEQSRIVENLLSGAIDNMIEYNSKLASHQMAGAVLRQIDRLLYDEEDDDETSPPDIS
jgi:hypothetical protein